MTNLIGGFGFRATFDSCIVGLTAAGVATASGSAGGAGSGLLRSMLSAMRGGIGAARAGLVALWEASGLASQSAPPARPLASATETDR